MASSAGIFPNTQPTVPLLFFNGMVRPQSPFWGISGLREEYLAKVKFRLRAQWHSIPSGPQPAAQNPLVLQDIFLDRSASRSLEPLQNKQLESCSPSLTWGWERRRTCVNSTFIPKGFCPFWALSVAPNLATMPTAHQSWVTRLWSQQLHSPAV